MLIKQTRRKSSPAARRSGLVSPEPVIRLFRTGKMFKMGTSPRYSSLGHLHLLLTSGGGQVTAPQVAGKPEGRRWWQCPEMLAQELPC